eukprot:TRINITY_DN421_c0_g1_i5.p1 TRINITY_DN421_c0_g1~~TRINITY_DN421_c0_g1_i5.p1  ORF type:complete len:114 (+),score=11.42 TRINITY_DN421_c0_g1_i5:489-830(+)
MYKERVIQRERDHLVLLTLMHNSRIAADTLYTTHGRATYYSKKAFNTDFRCKSHGGKRRGTFEDYELPVVKNVISLVLLYLHYLTEIKQKEFHSLNFVMKPTLSPKILVPGEC